MSEKQTEVVKFLNFLSNPNALSSNDLGEIKDWVEKYPYSQSLKFIAVKAAQKDSNYSDLLAEAATIAPSRKILHDLIHQPDNFCSPILPFSFNEEQTIEERQIAVAQEEKIQETEEPSKLAFGIDINEIYGSDHQTEKIEQDSLFENIEEETQEKEQFLASADEEVIEETEQESTVENIEEEKQEEISASADEVLVDETEEVLTSADEEVIKETQEETEVENIEEEKQEEAIVETEEESIVENIEEEEKQEEISASAEEEVIEQTEEESSVENIEEEKQEEVVEEVEKETEIENIEEENQEEVIASADEDQIEEVQETEEETRIGNIEQEKQKEILASVEEVEVNETEESAVENIEEEKQEEISASADEEPVVETEEATTVENIEEVVEETVEESIVENIEEETSKEEEKPIQKEEPAFQYAPQTDFFALNRKDKVEEKLAVEPELKADESVSAYNDERMPYTFLWWLNKTRKEHANTQPYSSFKLDTTRQIKAQETDGLNHQIAENIFHLRGVEELSSSATNYTVPFDFRKKEFQIIEKFIKEEPQIRPPAANKIDSENKAKKSSEDKNQVVSETLAKIYVEQMLYHKALDVYKKLSLKFPEKSTYFASQIKYLELKVN